MGWKKLCRILFSRRKWIVALPDFHAIEFNGHDLPPPLCRAHLREGLPGSICAVPRAGIARERVLVSAIRLREPAHGVVAEAVVRRAIPTLGRAARQDTLRCCRRSPAPTIKNPNTKH